MGAALHSNLEAQFEHFLAARALHFIPATEWIGQLGKDFQPIRMALIVAFREIGGVIPLYYREAELPERLDNEDTLATWSDLIDSFETHNGFPDGFFWHSRRCKSVRTRPSPSSRRLRAICPEEWNRS